jgi:hypothetical protein
MFFRFEIKNGTAKIRINFEKAKILDRKFAF